MNNLSVARNLALFVISILIVLGTGCGSTGVISGGQPATGSQLTASPTSLDFGSMTVGSTASKSLTVTATGSGAVTISQFNTTTSDFSVSGPSLPLTIGAGQSTTLTVSANPQSAGALSGTVAIVSNAASSPTSVGLTATAAAPSSPVLSLNPTSVGFGSVASGSSSSKSVVITNTGNASLTISQATVTGAGYAASGLSLPLTLAAGASTSFVVSFSPSTSGAANGNVALVSTAPNSPMNLPLTGTGAAAPVAQLSTNPASVSFGNVIVGNTGTHSVTVSNTGNVSVTISQIATSGSGFNLTGVTVPLALSPGQASTYTAQFAPTAAGAASGQISIASNASNSPTLISLSGTGIAAVAQLSTAPGSISFGNVNVGSSSTQAVTITNTGNVNVTVSQVTTTGSGFTGTGISVPLTLTPASSATYTATFSPTSAGSASGQISFVSDASNSPTVVSLSGAGVAQPTTLSVSPTSIPFGNVVVGNSSTKPGTLTASGGTVTVSSVAVTGSEYSISGLTLPVTLTAGQTATFSVVFRPTVAGSASASIAFTSTASNSPSVTLSGTGTASTTPCGLLDDGVSVHIPANYTSMTPPAKGQSYVDPAFGCTVTRLSDGRKDLGKSVYHEYASMTPINADDSMVALLDFNANWYIADLNGNILISSSGLPWQGGTGWRWSTTVRNVMYGVSNVSAAGCTASGNTLAKIVISGSSVTCSALHTFSEYSSISLGGGEGDISDDGDHIAVKGTLANGTADIFVYTISTNSKGGVFNYGTHAFDNAQITHSNRVVINWGTQNNVTCPTPGVPCYNGFELFSSTMSYIRQVFRNGVHSKELVDLSGNEVVAIVDSGAWFCSAQGQGIAVIDLNTGAGKCLLNNLPWNAGIHVGASANGWVVSEHLDYGANSTASYPLASNWQSLWAYGNNEIFLMRADGSQTRRLIHHRSFGAGDYWKVPRPSISRDGKWVIFDSDFGLGNPVGDYADVYLIGVQ